MAKFFKGGAILRRVGASLFSSCAQLKLSTFQEIWKRFPNHHIVIADSGFRNKEAHYAFVSLSPKGDSDICGVRKLSNFGDFYYERIFSLSPGKFQCFRGELYRDVDLKVLNAKMKPKICAKDNMQAERNCYDFALEIMVGNTKIKQAVLLIDTETSVDDINLEKIPDYDKEDMKLLTKWTRIESIHAYRSQCELKTMYGDVHLADLLNKISRDARGERDLWNAYQEARLMAYPETRLYTHILEDTSDAYWEVRYLLSRIMLASCVQHVAHVMAPELRNAIFNLHVEHRSLAREVRRASLESTVRKLEGLESKLEAPLLSNIQEERLALLHELFEMRGTLRHVKCKALARAFRVVGEEIRKRKGDCKILPGISIIRKFILPIPDDMSTLQMKLFTYKKAVVDIYSLSVDVSSISDRLVQKVEVLKMKAVDEDEVTLVEALKECSDILKYIVQLQRSVTRHKKSDDKRTKG